MEIHDHPRLGSALMGLGAGIAVQQFGMMWSLAIGISVFIAGALINFASWFTKHKSLAALAVLSIPMALTLPIWGESCFFERERHGEVGISTSKPNRINVVLRSSDIDDLINTHTVRAYCWVPDDRKPLRDTRVLKSPRFEISSPVTTIALDTPQWMKQEFCTAAQMLSCGIALFDDEDEFVQEFPAKKMRVHHSCVDVAP